jgi:hypothetical protein
MRGTANRGRASFGAVKHRDTGEIAKTLGGTSRVSGRISFERSDDLHRHFA